MLSRFTHTLSQFYQGLPLQCAAPTFKKHHFPTPSCSILAEFWPRVPHLHDTCFFSELGEICAKARKNVEHLRWRFESPDLSALRSAISSHGSGQDEISLSKQDCLTAYLVAILNHNRCMPVQKVTNMSSVSSLYD